MVPILAAVTMVNNALSVAQALQPLIQRQLSGGKDVTETDIQAALAENDAALAELDALIAEKSK